jgi:hypothetical protein
MSYQFEECQNLEIWDEFVANSLQSNIFCFSKFFTLTYTNFKLYFVKKNGNIILGCILILDKDGKNCTAPFMYQSILFDRYIGNIPSHRSSKITIDSLEFLLLNLEKYYKQLFFSLHYSIKDIRAFQWFNYHQPEKGIFSIMPKYSAILNINNFNSIDDVLKASRKVRSQEYRKSIKNGFKVSISKNVDILDNLHKLTFSRQGLKRSALEKLLIKNVLKTSIEEGFGRLLICSTDLGEHVSASLFLLDNNRGYYLLGGTNPKFRNYGVGSLIMFEQIKMCLDDGLKEIDFIGINSPMRGDYKTSFNAQSELYFDIKRSV